MAGGLSLFDCCSRRVLQETILTDRTRCRCTHCSRLLLRLFRTRTRTAKAQRASRPLTFLGLAHPAIPRSAQGVAFSPPQAHLAALLKGSHRCVYVHVPIIAPR